MSFWKQAGELFGQNVCSESRNGIAADISRKVNRSNMVFLRRNIFSPNEVKNHDLPVGFSHHFTVRAKYVTK